MSPAYNNIEDEKADIVAFEAMGKMWRPSFLPVSGVIPRAHEHQRILVPFNNLLDRMDSDFKPVIQLLQTAHEMHSETDPVGLFQLYAKCLHVAYKRTRSSLKTWRARLNPKSLSKLPELYQTVLGLMRKVDLEQASKFHDTFGKVFDETFNDSRVMGSLRRRGNIFGHANPNDNKEFNRDLLLNTPVQMFVVEEALRSGMRERLTEDRTLLKPFGAGFLQLPDVEKERAFQAVADAFCEVGGIQKVNVEYYLSKSDRSSGSWNLYGRQLFINARLCRDFGEYKSLVGELQFLRQVYIHKESGAQEAIQVFDSAQSIHEKIESFRYFKGETDGAIVGYLKDTLFHELYHVLIDHIIDGSNVKEVLPEVERFKLQRFLRLTKKGLIAGPSFAEHDMGVDAGQAYPLYEGCWEEVTARDFAAKMTEECRTLRTKQQGLSVARDSKHPERSMAKLVKTC